ncbi:MAG: TonB-dependent receptor, partial [Pseudomonas fluorescens]|nr:TonB-dependent receptor [Pseudomonas fluorescens]
IGATTTAYAKVADWARCVPLHYVGASCSYSPKDYLVGNPDLKPELAANYSLGVVLQPMKALSLSLDWYGVHQRDTIQSLDAQYLVDNEDKIAGYAALIGRDPRSAALEAANPGLNKGRINNITTPYTNVGKTITSGLDFDLKYDLDLGANGKLRFREVNNYTLTFEQSIAPGAAPSDRRDGLNHPKWKNSFRVVYELDDKEYGLTARTSASTLNITDPTYSQDAAVTNRRIPSYTVWDANFNLKASKQLRLNMGINNVFDKAMVYANTAYSDTYVQSLNDLVGRYVYINARYTFK